MIKPLFESTGPDGHVYRVFSDGRAEGFPEGSVFTNRFKGYVGTIIALALGDDMIPEKCRDAVRELRS